MPRTDNVLAARRTSMLTAKPTIPRLLIAALAVPVCAAALLAGGAPAIAGEAAADPAGEAAAPSYARGELVVRYRGGGDHVVELPEGVGVAQAAQRLSDDPRVAYAVPNYLAHATNVRAVADVGLVPNDPGPNGKTKGGWQATQWNLLPCGSFCAPGTTPLAHESRGGIDAPRAWEYLHSLGKPGGAGVKVAVLDTGVAYRKQKPKFVRSPDFSRKQFVRGFDFVGHDAVPVDQDGHGTHIAGTIAERTNNGKALTGIAYGAKVMPVRVLDARGEGKAGDIGRGLIWATKHGARVINMSFEFGSAVKSCKQVRSVCRGIRFATRRGVTVVSATGNDFDTVSAYPALAPGVIGVGASTEGGCLANYSNIGAGVDIVAPGGNGESGTTCHSADRAISQLTFLGSSPRRFGYPTFYAGTSMSAAHVSGVAALILASGELGARPSPARVLCQMQLTARRADLGEPYDVANWGAGLINAGSALSGGVC